MIDDKEGKIRVIAILDYWSQNALSGLHDSVMKSLTTFKADCTFNQGKRLYALTPSPKFYSLD